LPWRVVEAYGAEADDVIGTLCEWSQTNDLKENIFDAEPKPIMIVSGDGDFLQLQKWNNIRQFSPIHKKEMKADINKIPYILMEHICRGDTGDGIPNVISQDDCFVKGVRQTPLLKKKIEEWVGNPELILQDNKAKANFIRNKTLIDLSMTPENIKNNIIEIFETQPKKDRSKILNYFIANKMKQMIDVIGDF
jgi:hypothetical protein